MIQAAILAGGPVAPSGYHASAVNCADGTTLLSCLGLTCLDNGLFSMSFWFRTLAASYTGVGPFFYAADPLGHDITIMDSNLPGSGTWSPFFSTVGTSNNFVCNNATPVFDNVWHHGMFSTNTNFAEGLKQGKWYIDNVEDTNITTDFLGAFQSQFNGLQFAVLDDTFGEGYIGDIADLWIAPGVSLLDGGGAIPAATRALFIDPITRKPVNPTGFPSGAMLFSGNASGFPTNQGTGGAFTLTGALTNASTSPSG